jgi:hypothetical protein
MMVRDEPYPPREYWERVREEYRTSGDRRRHDLEGVTAHLVYLAVGIQSLAAGLFAWDIHPIAAVGMLAVGAMNLFVLYPSWARRLDDRRSALANRLPLSLRNPLGFHVAVMMPHRSGPFFGGDDDGDS